jgi:hypothetical protein
LIVTTQLHLGERSAKQKGGICETMVQNSQFACKLRRTVHNARPTRIRD